MTRAQHIHADKQQDSFPPVCKVSALMVGEQTRVWKIFKVGLKEAFFLLHSYHQQLYHCADNTVPNSPVGR